jgi:hypothetical protein
MTTEEKWMAIAATRLPQVEVDHVRSAKKGLTDMISDKEMRVLLVKNRWDNRICNRLRCGEMKQLPILCTNCYCTWYCSKQCEQMDQKVHKAWCAKSNALEIDKGPMKVVFVKTGPETLPDGIHPGSSYPIAFIKTQNGRDCKVIIVDMSLFYKKKDTWFGLVRAKHVKTVPFLPYIYLASMETDKSVTLYDTPIGQWEDCPLLKDMIPIRLTFEFVEIVFLDLLNAKSKMIARSLNK